MSGFRARAVFGLVAAWIMTSGGLAQAANVSWSAVGTDWAVGANWGGTPPANDLVTDTAYFNLASYPFQPALPTAARQVYGIWATNTGTVVVSGPNTLTLGAGGIRFGNSISGTCSIACPTVVAATQSWRNDDDGNPTLGSVTAGITINPGFTLTIDMPNNASAFGADRSAVNGVISGDGALAVAGGANNMVMLNANNTFTGGTTVSGAAVGLGHDNALGSGAVLFNSGAASLKANRTVANSFTMAGDVRMRPANNITGTIQLTWQGSATLSGANRTLNAENGNGTASLMVVDILGGVGDGGGGWGLTKGATGVLILSGSSSYGGVTTVSGGILRLNHASALAAGELTLGVGANIGLVELTPASGDLTRDLGTGAGKVRWVSGGSGFSAYGGNRTVTFSGAGTPNPIVWGGTGATSGFPANNQRLGIGSSLADSTLTIANNINLNGSLRVVGLVDGPAVVEGALAGVLSGTGTSGLLIYPNTDATGGGALRLDAANSYAGGTSVHNGTLIANAVGAIPGWVMASTDTADLNGLPYFGTVASAVSGGIAGNVTVLGGSTAKAANLDLSRVQILTGGALQFDAAGDLPAGTGVLNGTLRGAVMAAGYAVNQAFLGKISPAFRGAVALAADSSNNLDLSGLPNARLGAWGTTAPVSAQEAFAGFTFSGTLTPAGTTYKLGGGNTKLVISSALTGGNAIDVSRGEDPVLLNGYNGANQKAWLWPARVTLTGANTASGALNVGPYTVLTLSGASGALSSVSAVNINGGQVYLKDAAGAGNSARLPDAVPVTVNAGSTLRFAGTGGQTETAGTLTLNRGQCWVDTSRATGSGNAVLTFAGLSRTAGAMAIFGISNSQIKFTAAPSVGTDSALGGWAMTSGGFATWNGTTVGTLGTYNTGGESGWTDGLKNASMSAGVTLTASRSINLLRCTVGSTLALGNNNLTVNSGGIIVTSGTLTITSGTGTLTAGIGTGSSYELFLCGGNGQGIAVSGVIADNGGNPVRVVKGTTAGYTNGDWTLTLSGNNTYSGGTYLNQGATVYGHDNAFGTGPVYIVGFAQVDYNSWSSYSRRAQIGPSGTRILANAFHLYGDLNIYTGTTTFNGPFTLYDGANLCPQSATTTFNGAIGGTGSLRVCAGTMTLAGTAANTFNGPTAVFDGTLALNKTAGVDAIPAGGLIIGSAQNGGGNGTFNAKLVTLSAANQINNACTVLFIGGTPTANTATLRLNGMNETVAGLDSLYGAGIVENNSAATASTLGLSGSATNSFGGLIRNGSSATLAMNKSGSGLQTLTYPSTYSGGTTISGGWLFANGGFAVHSVQAGSRTAGSATITVTSTNGLAVGQSVSGTGIATGNTIATLVNATTVQLVLSTQTGTGATTLTFAGVSATGSGSVTVGTGVLGGNGAAGAVTLNAGGVIDPGTAIDTAGTMQVGGLTFSGGGMNVDIADATTSDQVLVIDSSVALSGALTVNLLDGYAPGSGEWMIMRVTGAGTITGTFTGLPNGWTLEKRASGTQLWLAKVSQGTLILFK